FHVTGVQTCALPISAGSGFVYRYGETKAWRGEGREGSISRRSPGLGFVAGANETEVEERSGTGSVPQEEGDRRTGVWTNQGGARLPPIFSPWIAESESGMETDLPEPQHIETVSIGNGCAHGAKVRNSGKQRETEAYSLPHPSQQPISWIAGQLDLP